MSANFIDSNFLYIIGMAVIAILAIWMLLLELRLKKLFRGRKAKDLEEVMATLDKELKRLDTSREEIEKYLATAEKRLRKSVQNVGVIRFNPFDDAGSNQSFAIALLDESGNGVVLSGLYSRDKVNVFAKPIEKHISKYTLTNEEKEAIKATSSNEKQK